jgi:hypothetical protein
LSIWSRSSSYRQYRWRWYCWRASWNSEKD